MKVIFLDIDGVLVTNRYSASLESQSKPWRDKKGLAFFCPKCLANVEELVRQTNAKVVLSSSWRFFLEDLEGVQKFFRSRIVQFDIYGLTPVIDYYEGKKNRNSDRGEEIQAWLDQHKSVTHYCILDDDPRILPHQQPYWVRTTFNFGFTQSKLEKALHILSGMPAAR